MEQKPVVDFDEEHVKEPEAKEKDNTGTTNKKLPKRLAVGVLLTEPKVKKIESKNLDEQKLTSHAASKTEPTTEAVERVTVPVAETVDRKWNLP